jgi:hypothetical protein
MTENEADQVAGYVFAAFPNQAREVSDLTWLAWRDILTRFPLSVGRAAAKQYLEGGNAFIPQPGEIALIADRVWQAQTAKERATKAIDRASAAKLLTGPAEAWGMPGSLARVAVQLVRDLCDGLVTVGSDAHIARQAEVERLAGPMPAPCCDREGLTSYVIVRWGRPYTYAARCDCLRGQQSPYVGYPVLPLGSARPVGVP